MYYRGAVSPLHPASRRPTSAKPPARVQQVRSCSLPTKLSQSALRLSCGMSISGPAPFLSQYATEAEIGTALLRPLLESRVLLGRLSGSLQYFALQLQPVSSNLKSYSNVQPTSYPPLSHHSHPSRPSRSPSRLENLEMAVAEGLAGL